MNKLKQMLRRWLGVNETPASVETVKREKPRKSDDAMSARLEEFLKEGYDFRFNVLTELQAAKRNVILFQNEM